MNIDTYLEKLKSEYDAKLGAKNVLERKINNDKIRLAEKENMALMLSKVAMLLNTVSVNMRDTAKQQLEKIVTHSLQYITSEPIEFIIELDTSKNSAVAQLYVKSEINGVESLQEPKDACGGGLVDIIATSLRYAYIAAFNDPVIRNCVLLDEPGKCISSDMSVKYAGFIKQLGQMVGKQTIMITHNDNLTAIADKTFMVQKKGYQSVVKEIIESDNLANL